MEAIWGNLLLYLCVFTPSCLPSKESGKQDCFGPIHPCLHWGSRLYLTPHPRPPPPAPPTAPPTPHPPLKGFSQVSQKGGFAKDLEGLEFLSGSRRCPGEKQQQHREEQLTGQPRHLCLTAPGHPFLLPSAHNTHPPPASCELGVRSRVALYHRNGSTISSVRSNLSPLA